ATSLRGCRLLPRSHGFERRWARCRSPDRSGGCASRRCDRDRARGRAPAILPPCPARRSSRYSSQGKIQARVLALVSFGVVFEAERLAQLPAVELCFEGAAEAKPAGQERDRPA